MSIVDRDPMLWKLAKRIESVKDITDDLADLVEQNSLLLKSIGEALEAVEKWFTLHEKRLNKLEKKNGKLR